MATSKEIQERIDAFARELSEEFGDVDANEGVCWLDAVENRALEIGDAVTVELMKLRALHRPVPGEATCPQCGRGGQYKGMRERELLSRRGPATIAEPEYFCPCCRKAFFPADASAGH